MSTINEILESMQDKLAVDADIEAYCQKEFKKSPKIYLGTDPDEKPPESDYPLIVLYAVPKAERGNSGRYATYEVIMGAGVWNETVDRTSDPKKVTYKGFPQAERLRELAESAILQSGVVEKIDVGSETFPDVIFPIFRSDTKIELQTRVSQRGPAQ